MNYIRIACPLCDTEVQDGQFNLKTDIAQCPNCENIFKLSSQLWEEWEDDFEPETPPKGVQLSRADGSIRIEVKSRSLQALVLTIFLSFLTLLFGASWISMALDMYGQSSAWTDVSVFVAILLGVLFVGAVKINRRTVINLDDEGGSVRIGGRLTATSRTFLWKEVESVEQVTDYFANRTSIKINGKDIAFGQTFDDPQRFFVLKCLKAMLRSCT